MVKINDDDTFLAAALGGASLLFVIDSVLAGREKTPTSANTISGVDAMGPLWSDVKDMDGFIAPFYIGCIDKSNLSGAAGFTDGMYEGSSRAEIVMIIPPFGKTIDATARNTGWESNRCFAFGGMAI